MTDARLEDSLLAHAERQTKALENIQSALMFLLALAILGAILGIVVLVRG